MTNKYPIFDPLNPEAFEPLSLKETWRLRDEDSAAHNEYGIQKQAWEAWKAEMLKIKMQSKNPVLDANDQYQGRRERMEIELMLKLGHAVEREGFEVKWLTGMWKGDVEVHPTWAKYAAIYKDGQKVGDFRTWRPNSGYSWNPVGWIIRTNRGVGNPNARWSGRDEKRLKKLESAIKYIKETAVPKIDVEADIKRKQTELQSIRIEISNLGTSIERAKNGMNGYRDSDGMLKQLLEMHRTGDKRGMADLLDARLELIERLSAERKALREKDDVVQDELNKLVEEAKEVLPEFYP